jgi:hypothetical protein
MQRNGVKHGLLGAQIISLYLPPDAALKGETVSSQKMEVTTDKRRL